MNNFLDVARNLWRSGELEESEKDFEDVFTAIGYLNEVHSKAKISFNNIEAVFTAFEMGKLIGKLPRIKGKKHITRLLNSLKVVIGYTLERTMQLKKTGNTSAPTTYYDFAGIIENLLKQKKECSIITFNYDLGLDYSLYERNIVPDYGIGDIDLENKRKVKLLKLHGSLNWGVCTNKRCKQQISPFRQFRYTGYYPTEQISILPIVSNLNKGQLCKTCQHPLEKTPFIVPPTWNKTSFHGQIEKVWEQAAKVLKDAEDIVVIGYSLPSTDWFFNYLFALGVDMTTPANGFYVYDIDEGVFEKFKNILGQDFEHKFYPCNISFEHAVRQTGRELGFSIKTIPQILNIKNESSNKIHVIQPKGS